jgi:lipid II:glycine glycyltransferase (peptidoglycan interpeptide bridge formation enzyme)
MPLEVRPVPADDGAAQAEYLAFVSERSGSFLQAPSWAAVKTEWGSELLGWYDSGKLVGVGLVLLRQTPRVKRYLAYLPEGPVIDWAAYPAAEVTAPLLAHLKQHRVFTVKMGPQLVTRRWEAETVKAAIAAGSPARLGEVPADSTDEHSIALGTALRDLGWEQTADAGPGFGDFQPRYVFQVPLAGRSEAELLAGFNQLWRRNIKKAEKAGVAVTEGGYDDLAAFHALYLETAQRDHFTPRTLHYFQRMWTAMRAEDPDRLRLYLAQREDQLLAATTWVRVGQHVWYSYGASSTDGREHRASNAVQWRMLADAAKAGATVYDLRGISDTLDPDDHLFGLVQFKLGTGGQAVEYLGEWDYPLSPFLHKAFTMYLARR